MDFNFNPEDEAFRMEFREWLNANKQFAPNMGETAIGMAEGRGEFEQQQELGEEDGRGQVARAELAGEIRRTRRGNFAEYRLRRGARARGRARRR